MLQANVKFKQICSMNLENKVSHGCYFNNMNFTLKNITVVMKNRGINHLI